jgi:hypothetical protein
MGGWLWLIVLAGGGVAALALLAIAALVIWQRRHIRRACEQFFAQRKTLAELFLQVASATGSPRGLRWKACDWNEEIAFARERKTGRLSALVSVTIQFEAVEGGDMEGVEAVGQPRYATAVLSYDGNRWGTRGRTIFNLTPAEALERLKAEYAPVPAQS